MPIRTQQELYDFYKAEVQTRNPKLTDFTDGSINDALAGAFAVGGNELQALLIEKFTITLFDGAEGQDLETLATDHFGDSFARPDASNAVGIVEFTRPTFTAGAVTIPAGTVVKTDQDANGEEKRYDTQVSVNMGATDVSVFASIVAQDEGVTGNTPLGTVINIESTLTDPSIEVNNAADISGGEEELDDVDYLEFIRNEIKKLAGGACPAIEAALENVPGIEKATVKEFITTVIEWNPATMTEIGTEFLIARVKAFISDANGTANAALIDLAETAIETVRGCGVKVEVISAVAVSQDWTGVLTLNPSGPNFATLSTDTTMIVNSMTEYLQNLDIGDDFVRTTARSAIMAIWGPAGSDDITEFQTVTPTGDVSTLENERLIPGVIKTQ